MFAKTIIDSDAFLDMPLSTQGLYFHLSMRADDDGFINNPKKIQRMIGCADDDLKLLVAKNFILPFDSGVVVIKHWRIHNYIRGDRRKDTVYVEEMAQLHVKDNGAYSLQNGIETILPLPAADDDPEDETPRQKAYRESSLPYSFIYKIRAAFVGRKCPICGCTMSHSNNLVRPTVQHNIPISKGGLHELGNISVVCCSCNSSIRDKETGDLNAAEVAAVWDSMTGKCQSNVSQVSDICHTQVRIGKDSVGKVSIGEDIEPPAPPTPKPVRHKYGEYSNVLLTDEEMDKLKAEFPDWQARIERLSSYMASTGKSYKNHLATIRNWARKDAEQPKRDERGGNVFLEMLNEERGL
jgi:hypothetical protein